MSYQEDRERQAVADDIKYDEQKEQGMVKCNWCGEIIAPELKGFCDNCDGGYDDAKQDGLIN